MSDPQPYEAGEDAYVRYAMECARKRAEDQQRRAARGSTQQGEQGDARRD